METSRFFLLSSGIQVIIWLSDSAKIQSRHERFDITSVLGKIVRLDVDNLMLIHSLVHPAWGCLMYLVILLGAHLWHTSLSTAHRGRDQRDWRPCPIKQAISSVLTALLRSWSFLRLQHHTNIAACQVYNWACSRAVTPSGPIVWLLIFVGWGARLLTIHWAWVVCESLMSPGLRNDIIIGHCYMLFLVWLMGLILVDRKRVLFDQMLSLLFNLRR